MIPRIIPRIILLGDTGLGATYVGLAKNLARRALAARLMHKTWRGAGVEIQIKNRLVAPIWHDPVLAEVEPRLKWIVPECDPEEIVRAEEEGRECEPPSPMLVEIPQPPRVVRDGFYEIGGRASSTIWIRAGEDRAFLAVSWVPEGILLTPRTAAAPHGYGFPKRHATTGVKINPPFGTLIADSADSALNQVLINRFENNKYLDRTGFVSGIPEIDGEPVYKLPDENLRLRADLTVPAADAAKTPLVYWPLFYTPADFAEGFWEQDANRVNWIDEPGINRWMGGYRFQPLKRPSKDEEGDLILPVAYRQFDGAGGALLYEAESVNWFCHWPEELLYDNDAAEALFQTTNDVRDQLGRLPITRELRGYANLGRMVCSEVQHSGVMYHDNEDDYRNGYGLVVNRFLNAGTNYANGRENLLIGVSGKTSEAGVAAAIAWISSPPHFATMVATTWDSPKHATSHDVFDNVSAMITEKGLTKGTPGSLDAVYDPPVSGKVWAQSFVKRDQWLYAGGVVQEGDYGRTTLFHFTSPIGPGKWTDDDLSPSTGLGTSRFFYQGRYIYNNQLVAFSPTHRVMLLGAVACVEDGVPIFRQIVLLQKVSDSVHTLQCYTRPVHAYHADWTLEASNETIVADMASNVNFSEITFLLTKFSFKTDGSHGVITVAKNKLTARPTYFNPAAGEATRMNVVHSIIEYTPAGGFAEMAEVVGPNITYTFVVESPRSYTQIGSGFVESYPQYDVNNNLIYLKHHFDVDVRNGPDAANGRYVVKQWIEFASETVFDLVDLYVTRVSDVDPWPILNEAAFSTHILYLDSINEDVVYYRIYPEVSADTQEWVDQGYIINGAAIVAKKIDLAYNDTILRTTTEYDFPLHFRWMGGTGFAWETRHAAPTRISIHETEPEFLDNGAYNFYTMHFSFLDIRQESSGAGALLPYTDSHYFSIQYIVDPGWSIINGGLISGGPGIYVGKLLTGTMPVCLGLCTALGDVLSCTATHMQSGYNLALPIAHRHYRTALDIINDNNRERVYCWFARYEDRVLFQVDWDFAAQGSNSYIWKAVWPEGGWRTIYANFPLEDEAGIGEITNILPMGVV